MCFFTVTIAGVQWLNKNPFDLSSFSLGLPYAFAVFTILSAHEFGHYFAARYHHIDTTLPYYIPAPSFLLNPFGTLGAVIRVREPLTKRNALFDVGIAGPLAGLIVTFAWLYVGFQTVPDMTYLYKIHPDYVTTGIPPNGFTFGSSLLFSLLSSSYHGPGFFPPMNEIYHYPFLCAGWFGLFITALNLIPIGQLDGGHILYALLGKFQGNISRVLLGILVGFGLSGFVPNLPWTGEQAMYGWIFWTLVLYFIIKVDHPPVDDPVPLTPIRTVLGWVTLIFFILIFPPLPFSGLIE